MMVGLFCIAITKGEFREFIGRKQLDIVIGSSEGSGYPDSTSGHYEVKHMMSSSFFISSFCLLLATSHLYSVSKLKVFCMFINCLVIRSPRLYTSSFVVCLELIF